MACSEEQMRHDYLRFHQPGDGSRLAHIIASRAGGTPMSVAVKVINCMHGRPAAGVSVRLEGDVSGTWVEHERDLTDDHGRVAWLGDERLARGFYRLEFNLDSYFFSLGITPVCAAVSLQFRMADPAESHDVSLFISPSSFFAYGLQ
jgi:5-hydroxyisourate hydrolase